MKTFWFGVKSNTAIGMGHLSRCIAIAEELRERGHAVCFDHTSNLDSRSLLLLDKSQIPSECICMGKADVLIVDSYDLSFINLVRRNHHSTLILVIDDFTPRVAADGYIEASPLKEKCLPENGGKVFKFQNNPILRKKYDPRNRAPERNFPWDILIFLGSGNNQKKIIKRLLESLKPQIEKINRICIVDTLDNLEFYTKIIPGVEIILIDYVFDAWDLFINSDFVISAAGVSAWELISLEVPGVLVATTDNQYEQLDYLNKTGLRFGLRFDENLDFDSSMETLFAYCFENTVKKRGPILQNGRIGCVNWMEKLFTT